jgi:hypothetical protein
MCSFKSVLKAVASPLGTRASAHPPSLARGRGKYKLSRLHPNGSRRGTATIFGIARATRSTGEDASDQSSPTPSRDEQPKSFGEGERPQWLASAESSNLRDQAVGGQSLRAGSLGPPQREQTTKRGVEPCAPETRRSELQNRGAPGCFSMDRKHQRFGTRVVELPKSRSL